MFPADIRKHLIQILDSERVRDDELTIYSYSCDGLSTLAQKGMGVLFPKTKEEIAQVVKYLSEEKISFVPRGAGTGLSGGAIPLEESVVIDMFHFKGIEDIDLENRTMTVGAGTVNIHLSNAVKNSGYQFVPDPSSQKACQIGGNVGENSGGPHTLKYGVTVNHVLGIEMVTADGEIVSVGGKSGSFSGPDVLGLLIGSEGTLGIITKVICRLTPLPEKVVTLLAMFSSHEKASQTVSGIIDAGIIPSALEMIDNLIIQAIEKSTHPGFPLDVAALLIIEIEGMAEGLEEVIEQVNQITKANNPMSIRRAKTEKEREVIWEARKGAIGALGSISPNFHMQDGVVPRAQLSYILNKIESLSKEHGLLVGNVFHAGDGNLHPLILFDQSNPGEEERAIQLGKEIMAECVGCGGTLTGEHGIGLEKNNMMPMIFNEEDLQNFRKIKQAFDPKNRMNPGKIFPTPGRCADVKIAKANFGVAV